jgi:hypothetical protein
VTTLLLTVEGGDRTLVMAQCVVHQVVQVLVPDCVPLLLTDGFKEYTTALLAHFGQWVQLPRRHAPGSLPTPRWMPLPHFLYARVVTIVRRRRLVRGRHRVVCGTLEAIQHVLAADSWQITTAFLERLTLDIRPHVAVVGRRVNTLCNHAVGLPQQLALFQVYHNCCLPHSSVRQPLLQPEPTNGTGCSSGGPALRRWQWE